MNAPHRQRRRRWRQRRSLNRLHRCERPYERRAQVMLFFFLSPLLSSFSLLLDAFLFPSCARRVSVSVADGRLHAFGLVAMHYCIIVLQIVLSVSVLLSLFPPFPPFPLFPLFPALPKHAVMGSLYLQSPVRALLALLVYARTRPQPKGPRPRRALARRSGSRPRSTI